MWATPVEWVAVKGVDDVPEQGAEPDGFLRREDLIAVAPPDEGGEAHVRPGEVIERFLVVQDVLHGLDVVGRVDAGAAFAHLVFRALHGFPEIVLGATSTRSAILMRLPSRAASPLSQAFSQYMWWKRTRSASSASVGQFCRNRQPACGWR